ncbi:UDP-glucuronate decarboxylase [Plantibacter sp. RU18]
MLLDVDLASFNVRDIVRNAAKEHSVETVFHLACPASPIDYFSRPIETLEVCSTGTQTAALAALDTHAVLVFTSTSEVYGDPLESPQSEDYWGNVNPTGPRAAYDEGKRYAEALITAMGRQLGLKYRIARLFNTYGPGMRANDGRIVPAIIGSLRSGKPIPIFGNGLQTRSLCFIDDTVSGILALAASDVSGPMNIGRDDENTILEIAGVAATILNVPLRTELLPARADDPVRRRPDVSLARRSLGWEALTSLPTGISSTIDYFASLDEQADISLV